MQDRDRGNNYIWLIVTLGSWNCAKTADCKRNVLSNTEGNILDFHALTLNT